MTAARRKRTKKITVFTPLELNGNQIAPDIRSEAECSERLEQFLRMFLERELPQFGISAGARAMRRFWSMHAHGPGQVWNASEIGRSMGLSDTTVRSYLDKMADAYVGTHVQYDRVDVETVNDY